VVLNSDRGTLAYQAAKSSYGITEALGMNQQLGGKDSNYQ